MTEKFLNPVSAGLVALMILGTPLAQATLSLSAKHGEQVVEHPVPGRNPEICITPRHLQPGSYSDKDLQKEKFLCSLENETNVRIQPKTNSTNPGLDFYSLKPGEEEEKLAKYKLSTSCSYAPSLLGYYHVSRLLGGAGHVPPAVLRTIDLESHLRWGDEALKATNPSDLIHTTWASLVSSLRAGSHSSRKDGLLTDSLDQSYGALEANPRGETFYKEFFAGGTDNLTRAQNFKTKAAVALLLGRSQPVASFVGRELNAVNLQKIVQMQDASEMIILDSLLSQQDRFGNIHFTKQNYIVNTSASGESHLHSEKDLSPEEAAKALTVKRMILKDNDCGVAKVNVAVNAGLPSILHHLEPSTYKKLLLLDRNLDSPAYQEFFRQDLLFTALDFEKFRSNSHDLVSQLKKSCQSGELFLDLNLDQHFFNKASTSVTCELE